MQLLCWSSRTRRETSLTVLGEWKGGMVRPTSAYNMPLSPFRTTCSSDVLRNFLIWLLPLELYIGLQRSEEVLRVRLQCLSWQSSMTEFHDNPLFVMNWPQKWWQKFRQLRGPPEMCFLIQGHFESCGYEIGRDFKNLEKNGGNCM